MSDEQDLRRKSAHSRSHVDIVVDVSPGLAELLNKILDPSKVERQLSKIQRSLDKIMASQEELDAKVAALQASNDAFRTQLTAIRAAIAAEAEQVAILVANNPNLDFSALDAAIAETAALVTSSETVDEETSEIYTPEPEA
jgi:capsule polysaccharide export protein KpsE/RkpR